MLELRSLRHFVTLAQRLNYGRAAQELGITQPSLSRSIQALERQLGARLFDRDRGGVRLTPLGRQMAHRASCLLLDAEDLERHAKLHGLGESGRIRFGMAPMAARALLRSALAERLELAPNVTNEVLVRDVEPLWEMLVAGEIEFFVSPNRPLRDLSAAKVELLGLFPLSLIVRAGHPLSRGARGQKFPLLRSSWTGMSVPSEVEPNALGDANVVEDFATLAEVTSTTNAMWLSSAYVVAEELRNGSLVELFRAKQHVEVALYALKRRSRSPLAEILAETLRRHTETLLAS